MTPIENSFHFRNIIYLEALDEINNLKTKKAQGIDGVSTKLLKDAGDTVLEPLVNIFNMSLQTGIFPDDWKMARVLPVFKE